MIELMVKIVADNNRNITNVLKAKGLENLKKIVSAANKNLTINLEQSFWI